MVGNRAMTKNVLAPSLLRSSPIIIRQPSSRHCRRYVVPIPFQQGSHTNVLLAMNNHQQEGNAAAGALAERMVNVLTLDDKKKKDEEAKNADKEKNKKPVANDANDVSLEDDASSSNLDQSTYLREAVDNAEAVNLVCLELIVPAQNEPNEHDGHAIDARKQGMMVAWRLEFDPVSDPIEDDTTVFMNPSPDWWRINFSHLSKSYVNIRSGLGHCYTKALADLKFFVIVTRIQVDRPDHHGAPKYGFEMDLYGLSRDPPFKLLGQIPAVGTYISPQQFDQLAGLSDQNVRDKFGLLAADETPGCPLFADETAECIFSKEECIPVDQRVLEETLGRDLVVHLKDIWCPFRVIRHVCQMPGTAEPRLTLNQLIDHDIAEKE
jgi:hypothetical protein